MNNPEKSQFGHNDESFLDSLSPHDRKIMSTIDNYLENNYSDPDLNVETLSYEIGMSRVSLYRKFKALTDTSPKLYIRDYRLAKAAELLKAREYEIQLVSDKVGFSDMYYFRKCFEQKYGVKPEKV